MSARRPCHRVAGNGLLAVLLLSALLSAAGLLAQGELRILAESRAQARSVEALSQAREALIGYAISYAERHPGEGHGHLPCPDAGNSGSSTLGACGARSIPSLGRLPWRTLALPELRDGWHECLWYAVAGSVKNNPKPLVLNWDSPGQFGLFDRAGRQIAAAGPDSLAIAVIIAPGAALTGQIRINTGAGPCPGSASAIDDLPAFLDGGNSLVVPSNFRQGGTADLAGNDVLAWIGIDDIHDALRRRHDHADRIEQIGARAATALDAALASPDFIATHLTAAAGGLVATGPLPLSTVLALPGEHAVAHDNWRDQFRIAACIDGSPCVTVRDTDSDTLHLCRAALLFGGERIREGPERQRRTTTAEREDAAQYLEGDNAHNYASGIPRFAGAPLFRTIDPRLPATQDVVRCIP